MIETILTFFFWIGQYKWDEDISLEYTSGFMVFVYTLWNIYIMALIFLYAPSHKQWTNNDDHEPTNTGEEIEFSVASVASAGEASEMSSLTDFIRHPAQD